MIAEQIRVTPFNLSRIISCEIKKEPNEHGKAYVKGYTDAQDEESCLRMLSKETSVQIEAIDECGQSRVIFHGRIKDSKIGRDNQLLMVEMNLITHTSLMDLEKRIRAFQTPQRTYQSIFDTVMKGYFKGGCILTKGQDAITEEFIVQYQETDWEFIKRLASHLQTVIVPEVQTEGVKVYVGLPQRSKCIQSNTTSYKACKWIQDYLYKQQNQVEGLLEDDELCYEIQEQEMMELGEQIELWGKKYYVVGTKSYLDGHQMWSNILLKRQKGVSVPKQYNDRIVGASMDGRIMEVQEAQVKIKLSADGAGEEKRWFPFSTVYSSPDGSGWYCMPEVGDEIRLYFPTIKEKHAYVISAVHLPVNEGSFKAAPTGASSRGGESRSGGYSTGSPETYSHSASGSAGYSVMSAGGYSTRRAGEDTIEESEIKSMDIQGGSNPKKNTGSKIRSNPNEKIILTETGKMVKLTPTQIHLSNGKGLDIILDDREGIMILSDKMVNIRSNEMVNIASGMGVELVGMNKVQLSQGKSTIMLIEEKVRVRGAEIRMQ